MKASKLYHVILVVTRLGILGVHEKSQAHRLKAYPQMSDPQHPGAPPLLKAKWPFGNHVTTCTGDLAMEKIPRYRRGLEQKKTGDAWENIGICTIFWQLDCWKLRANGWNFQAICNLKQ